MEKDDLRPDIEVMSRVTRLRCIFTQRLDVALATSNVVAATFVSVTTGTKYEFNKPWFEIFSRHQKWHAILWHRHPPKFLRGQSLASSDKDPGDPGVRDQETRPVPFE